MCRLGLKFGDLGRLTKLKMNLGGATDRPVLAEVWKNIQKKLQGEDDGTEGNYTTTGVLHLVGQKIFGR